MTKSDASSAPRSLQEEILDRTWFQLEANGFSLPLIASLKALNQEGKISHTAQVVSAIESSVENENP